MRKILEDVVKNNEEKLFEQLIEKTGQTVKKEHLAILSRKDTPLPEYLSVLFDTYQEMLGLWTFVWLMGDVVNDYVLEQKLATTLEEMLERLAPFTRRTLLEKQSLEIKEIAKEIMKANPHLTSEEITEEKLHSLPTVSQAIDGHVREFRWFGTHHWMGEPYDREKCIADVKQVLKKGLKEDTVKADTGVKADPFWELLATITYWRTHCAEVTAKVVFESRPRLLECAKQWGLAYDELTHLSSAEIMDRVSTRFSEPENYTDRFKSYGGYLDEQGSEHIVTGHELKEILDTLLTEKIEAVRELKGSVASKGKTVTGTVKVLISPHDFAKFEHGDILVAPETTPDFVPAMKKAAAIVTDRGGITSHAAIISRELGIPCVIGTKIGTHVLKDGMRVQVDTETGLVSILD